MAKKKDIQTDVSLKLETEYQKWVDVYFNFNFNGKLTSKQLKPHLTMGSAEVDAARMLGNARVQEIIELKREQIRQRENIKLDFLIHQLTSIVLTEDTQEIERDANNEIIRSKTKSNNSARIQAMNLLSKIAGFETKKVDITSGGEKITWNETKTYNEEDETD